ncbi:MAG: hypothetical protein KBG10_06585 [Anaerolineaceae bacterium]|nr:hypothetical protein [Anaerolineaceae bacterium]
MNYSTFFRRAINARIKGMQTYHVAFFFNLGRSMGNDCTGDPSGAGLEFRPDVRNVNKAALEPSSVCVPGFRMLNRPSGLTEMDRPALVKAHFQQVLHNPPDHFPDR